MNHNEELDEYIKNKEPLNLEEENDKKFEEEVNIQLNLGNLKILEIVEK